MLKIVCWKPNARNFFRLQHNDIGSKSALRIISTNSSYKNINFGNENTYILYQKRHFPFQSAVGLLPRLHHEVSKPNYSNFSYENRPLQHKNAFFISQKRYFSFQSTVESLARTHLGIFQTLSESTPVEYCQNFLLSVHNTTGLPWWASIICSTILMRTVITLPLAVYQHYILAKLENLHLEFPEIVKQLKNETAIAVKMYNWDEKTARATYNRSLRKQWNNLIIRDNCHPFKTSILLLFQIPMWISLSISLRNLVYMLPHKDISAQLTFTELSVEGFWIIPNLTLADSSWIFPIALGIINLLIIELQILAKSQNTPSTKLQTILKNTFRALSIVMVPIAASVPSCLVLYWTTSSTYGLVQNVLLMSPKVKRLVKIPQTASEVKHPYENIFSNLKAKLKLP